MVVGDAGESVGGYVSAVDGTVQPYRVYLPRRWRARYPVLVCLHGFGGRMSAWSDAARHLADAFGWVLLSPDGRGSQNWDWLGEDDLLAALDSLAGQVAVDHERVYLHGGSMGGHGALRTAWRYPWRFAAVSAVAGWISAEQFYRKWYAAPGEPPPESIAHLVEAAAPWAWREHAALVPGRLAYGMSDDVNEPEDAEWLVAWLRRQGWFGRGGWQAVRAAGGHGAGLDWWGVFRFLARHRRRWPTSHMSWTLRHAAGGWYRAERLSDPRRPARFGVRRTPAGLELTVENVAELTVEPARAPIRRAVEVVGGEQRWALRPGAEPQRVDLAPTTSAYLKRRGADGPVAEIFRDRFQVLAPADGPDQDDAQRFCGLWNAWLVLRWRDGDPPEREPWWRPPYPWPPGAWVPASTPLLAPQPPSAERAEVNLVAFGGVDANPVARRFADWRGALPFRPLRDGLRVGDEVFAGKTIRYLALHPVPWRPERLLLLCGGWPDSGIDPREWPPGVLGKDFERLPWQFPDVVVWDAARPCRMTVQPPLRHLPDAWLMAATLGPTWSWSGARVWRR